MSALVDHHPVLIQAIGAVLAAIGVGTLAIPLLARLVRRARP